MNIFNPLTDFKPLVDFFLNRLKRATATMTETGENDVEFTTPPDGNTQTSHSSQAPPAAVATGANAITLQGNSQQTENWQQQHRGISYLYFHFSFYFSYFRQLWVFYWVLHVFFGFL